ncbi:MAG: hypothetical protein FJZ05_02110, partial [Candidatus Nealsonbacteria bacterium]|nr:hypothetical protein [Candidatus Nealsonbacteria bacterium]
MGKKKKHKNNKRFLNKQKKPSIFYLPEESKKWISGVVIFILAIIVALSFFDLAGVAGAALIKGLTFLIGKTIFLIPLILVLAGIVFFSTKYKKFFGPTILAIFILIIGVSGIIESFAKEIRQGGWLGYLLNWPFLKFFGILVTRIVFSGIIVIGLLIFWHLIRRPEQKEVPKTDKQEIEKEPSLIKKIFLPQFKVREVEPKIKESPFKPEEPILELETKKLPKILAGAEYKTPPLELLETDKGRPTAGDTVTNSAIIKKTLENFGLPVEMSEINIGPTVTQYSLKPAEGIKLSKITALSNNLSLALASHPIRIEAPIPGKSLVGIEVPNKTRCQIRMRDIVANPQFQSTASGLNIVLGKDVSGNACYADLARMPHLLVAGATGTGKTCAADTFMFTEKGMLTFEELYPLPLNSEKDFKVKIVTRDGIEETAKNYNNGVCRFYKLSTCRGYQIEATAEHPLWVMEKDGSQNWKSAALIKEGDYVAISRSPALFGNRVDISDFKPNRIKAYHKKITFPSKLTPQLAQFLGFLTADGGLSVEGKGLHRIVYTQANAYLLSLYKKALKELFGITKFIEKKSGSNPENKATDIEVNSKHLKEFLAYLGMHSDKSPQKETPRAIREAPKEIVVAYLRALFDNDGYLGERSIEFCISSKKLSSQIHLMLLNFGIVSSLAPKKVKKYAHNNYYRISIFGGEARKFVRNIGFIRKEKYKKAKKLLKLVNNPNVDLIPNISHLLKKMGQKYLNRFAVLTHQGWKYQSGILVPKYAFNSLRSYNAGYRVPGYQSLEKILDFYQPIFQEPEYQELEKISERNFYWDKIKEIGQTSGVGYDFFVPGSDSFVGNGFVNHNTIFLNSLILSLLYQNSPETLRFILADPKRVEFSAYKDLPHLLTPVIFDPQRTINALKWLIVEMEKRFDILSGNGSRNIDSYNAKVMKEGGKPLPYIVLIVDELADLMAAKGREMEAGIVRLAQMARAVGIHLVVATQRPSVEVITGLIKANITSRVTFQVASQVDSRTVLDMAGAEKLLGAGDLLFISADVSKPKRIQGPYISEKEVKKVIDYVKSQREESLDSQEPTLFENHLAEDLEKTLDEAKNGESFDGYSGGEDPLYE